MSESKKHTNHVVEEPSPETRGHPTTPEGAAQPEEGTSSAAASAPQDAQDVQGADEVEVLREELQKAQAELAKTQEKARELNDKYLRARADLENYRRRMSKELERARESGLDSAVVAVLPVYDDLGRALEAAGKDPAKIIPGIEAVREGLKRNLEALGIKEVGEQGEAFNPDFHEALTSLEPDDEALAGTIAEVFQVGFVKEERLVRPARVAVYQGE